VCGGFQEDVKGFEEGVWSVSRGLMEDSKKACARRAISAGCEPPSETPSTHTHTHTNTHTHTLETHGLGKLVHGRVWHDQWVARHLEWTVSSHSANGDGSK